MVPPFGFRALTELFFADIFVDPRARPARYRAVLTLRDSGYYDRYLFYMTLC